MLLMNPPFVLSTEEPDFEEMIMSKSLVPEVLSPLKNPFLFFCEFACSIAIHL